MTLDLYRIEIKIMCSGATGVARYDEGSGTVGCDTVLSRVPIEKS